MTAHTVGRQPNWAIRKQNVDYPNGDDEGGLSSHSDKTVLRCHKVYAGLMASQTAGDYSFLLNGNPVREIAGVSGIKSAGMTAHGNFDSTPRHPS